MQSPGRRELCTLPPPVSITLQHRRRSLTHRYRHVSIDDLRMMVGIKISGLFNRVLVGLQVQGSNTTTGQLLTQGNGTYLIQQSVVDGDPTTHTLISAAAARASPQTESAVSCLFLFYQKQKILWWSMLRPCIRDVDDNFNRIIIHGINES